MSTKFIFFFCIGSLLISFSIASYNSFNTSNVFSNHSSLNQTLEKSTNMPIHLALARSAQAEKRAEMPEIVFSSIFATPPTPSSSLSEQRTYLSQAHMQFTFDLLGNLLYREHMRPSDLLASSFTFSPLSVQSILMMLQLASAGHTRQQIVSLLHLSNLMPEISDSNRLTTSAGFKPFTPVQNVSSIQKLFASQLNDLLEAKQVRSSLNMANRLLYRKQLRLRARLHKTLTSLYGASCVQPLDFGDPERCLQIINDFVSSNTNGQITNFLSAPPSISSAVIALNALHFHSDWRYGFDERDTEIAGIFHLSNGRRVNVPIMVGTLPVAFAQSPQLKASAIELPYKPAARLSMFLLLPDDVHGLLPMLRALNASSFYQLVASMRKHSSGVNVRLPRFQLNSQHALQSTLSAMGMRSLFSAGECDLSAAFANPALGSLSSQQPGANHVQPTSFGPSSWFGPLHVSDFVHRATLRLDEQGTVAAAASATLVERVGLFNGPYFEADHPFVFLLLDKQTSLVLFAGIYAGPAS